MNKTKVWFGLMIIFLIALWAIIPFWFGRISIIQIKPIVYNYTEQHSCHITLTEPTIILRMDDVRFQSKIVDILVDETLKENISLVLGVIPEYLGNNKNLLDYLKKIKNDERVEIAQHGVYHNESDISIDDENLMKGNMKIQELIVIAPITYIPPYNNIKESSFEFVKTHFKIISSGGGIIKEGEIAELGKTTETYDYYNDQEVSIQSVVDKCSQSLKNYNVCVVVVHPQEFGLEKIERLDDYRKLLYGLKQLDATFSTFNKVIFCEEKKKEVPIGELIRLN